MKDNSPQKAVIAMTWGPWIEPGRGFAPADLSAAACKTLVPLAWCRRGHSRNSNRPLKQATLFSEMSIQPADQFNKPTRCNTKKVSVDSHIAISRLQCL